MDKNIARVIEYCATCNMIMIIISEYGFRNEAVDECLAAT